MNGPQHNTVAVLPQPKPRKGPRPSAETIRRRVSLMIGSANVDRLAQEGYAIVPNDFLVEMVNALADFVPDGDLGHE